MPFFTMSDSLRKNYTYSKMPDSSKTRTKQLIQFDFIRAKIRFYSQNVPFEELAY